MPRCPSGRGTAARLALLSALASAEVDDAVVAAYRAVEPDDRALIELTSWASLAAARTVGEWTHAAGRPTAAAPLVLIPELVGR